MNDRQATKSNRWSLCFTKFVALCCKFYCIEFNHFLFYRLNKTERSDVCSPPGYTHHHGYVQNESSREIDNNLIVKKSWDIALAPLKQIPMNLFIMYMAGNSISILPIMMVGMLFLGPIKAIFSFNKSILFERYITESFLINSTLILKHSN